MTCLLEGASSRCLPGRRLPLPQHRAASQRLESYAVKSLKCGVRRSRLPKGSSHSAVGGSGLAPPAVQPGSNLELLAGHMIDLRDTVGKTVAETNTSVRNLANELGAFTNYQEGVNEEQGLVNRHTDERVCDLETRTAEQGNVLGHTKVRMSKLETRMFLAKKSNRANATRISSVEGVVTSVGQFLAESHGYQPRTNGEEAE